MAQTVCVLLSTSDRSRLEAIASDRNQPRRVVILNGPLAVLPRFGGAPTGATRGDNEVAVKVARWFGAGSSVSPERRGQMDVAARQDAQAR